jgi:hypothetical protein
VRVDREARAITAVERNDLSLAAIADDVEPPQGLPTSIRWRLTNRRDEPLSISIVASGVRGLDFDHRVTLRAGPGEMVEARADIPLPVDVPPSQDAQPAPAVRSLFILEQETLELGTGFRYRPPVEIDTEPRLLHTTPGGRCSAHLRLRSHLPEDAIATLRLTPAPGLTADWQRMTLDLPSDAYAGLPVTVEGTETGVLPLTVAVDLQCRGQRIAAQPTRVPVFVRPSGVPLADRTAERVWVATDHFLCRVQAKGGIVLGFDRAGGKPAFKFQEALGPPFEPRELQHQRFDLAVEASTGRLTVISTAQSEDRPGLTLRRRLTFGGSLVRVSYALGNHGRQSHQVQIRSELGFSQREQGRVVLPLQEGIVGAHATAFPQMPGDSPQDPDRFAERWLCVVGPHTTVGWIWSETLSSQDFGRRLDLYSERVTCPPGQWTELDAGTLYAGPGGWRAVRAAARRRAGQRADPDLIPPQIRPLQTVRLEPEPLVTLDDRLETTLVVDNLRGRPLEGLLRVEAQPGWTVKPNTFTLKDVTPERRFSAQIDLSTPSLPGPGRLKAQMETPLAHRSFSLPVVRLGSRRQVDVRHERTADQPVLVLDNGRFIFQVAPDFGPALVGWRENEVNHVRSPFAQVGALGWLSPWFGGLAPVLYPTREEETHEFPGRLHQERFTGEPVTVVDGRHIPWQGVRLTADLERDALRGLRLEFDLLTLGGSQVLRVALRLVNETTAERRVDGGWIAFPQIDGDYGSTVLWSEGLQRRRTPWPASPEAGHWGAATNPESDRTLILVSPYPRVRLHDWGGAGGNLGWLDTLRIPARGQIERLGYLILADDAQTARGYRCLREYQ